MRRRDAVAARLAHALTALFGAARFASGAIGAVYVCGGLPELRSMTVPLLERLDVEVEPLDSMFGIDPAAPPEPVEEFREGSASLRMAWAVVATGR